MENYKFFCNNKCEFFPCHSGIDTSEFNCLFCYCPLYLTDCGGNYRIIEGGIKDCSECCLPHIRKNYDYIIKRLEDKK